MQQSISDFQYFFACKYYTRFCSLSSHLCVPGLVLRLQAFTSSYSQMTCQVRRCVSTHSRFLLQYSFVTLIVSIRRDQPPVGRTLFSLQCLNARRARNNVLFCLHLLRIYTVAYFHLDQTPSDRKKATTESERSLRAPHFTENCDRTAAGTRGKTTDAAA